MAWLVLWLSTALASQAVSINVIHTVHAPKKPALVLTVNVAASSLEVSLRCGPTTAGFNGPAAAGRTIRIDLDVPAGQHACEGSLSAEFNDGTSGSMPLTFPVAVQDPIQMQVTMDDLDLPEGRLRVHLNQEISQLDVDVYGETGKVIASASRAGAPETPLLIEWTATTEAVTRLKVTATGNSELSTTLDLFPWRYAIPHEDVVFPTGSSRIPESEIPKLIEARNTIQATLERFAGDKLGFEIPMQLFVAGYTDTVGNRIANQRLSEARAKAIGEWFQANGFSRPVHYQGFGERGLAVPTPDETDAAANRRAAYIIAAETPPASTATPSGAWNRLR